MSASLESHPPSRGAAWALSMLAGVGLGTALITVLLCLPASELFLLHPIASVVLGVVVVAGAAIGMGLRRRSISKGGFAVIGILLGLVASSVPPVNYVVQTASTWITFAAYKRVLDREVANLHREGVDAAFVKVTVSNMMLMSRGYAYDGTGQRASDPTRPNAEESAAKFGAPCVQVDHLYGHYYAWHSAECGK